MLADEPVSAGRAIPTGSNETLMSGGGERISQLSDGVEPVDRCNFELGR
jgi:hypothetical protein